MLLLRILERAKSALKIMITGQNLSHDKILEFKFVLGNVIDQYCPCAGMCSVFRVRLRFRSIKTEKLVPRAGNRSSQNTS